MELTWPVKIRIAAAAIIGILSFGIFAWPTIAPKDPFGLVLLPQLPSLAMLLVLAFAAGAVSYFVCWPYGREVGILAVPIGLSIWAMKSGSVATFIQQNPSVAARREFFSAMRIEPVGWLMIAAAGFAGVLAAQLIAKPKRSSVAIDADASEAKFNKILSVGVAVIATVLVTNFLIALFAQGPRVPDARFGSVVAGPKNAQIAFAVFVAFGIAAGLAKHFLNVNYIWPAAASVFLPAYSTAAYLKADSLQYLAVNQPPMFFPISTIAVLPVQIVSIGIIGAVVGFWAAVRYDFWRKNEI